MKVYNCLTVIALACGITQSAHSAWPTGVADNVTVSTGQRVYIPVLANDVGENLTLTEINERTVALGTVEMNSAKTAVFYRSASGFTGDDSFWYAFTDNLGQTNATQVFLKVISFGDDETPAPPPQDDFSGWPAANVDTVTTSKNAAITVPVLANDIGDSLVLTTVNDWTVNGGRASIQGDNVRYTPKSNYVGQDSFWYDFVDARGRANATQVKVTISDQNNGGPTEGTIDNAVHISMHYDLMKGQRFVWGESGGTQAKQVTQLASAGSSQIKVSGGFNLVDNQLVTYRSTDGQYYTVATSSSSGDTINLKTSLPAPISQSESVRNFYSDGAHPNTYGFFSIADFALRNTDVSALNSGKHVMLGDSWFQSYGIYQRLAERLGNARITNMGLGGSTTASMLSSFDSQIAPQNPDVVWLMAGTNDYFQGVSVSTYTNNMRQLLEKINAIGAKAMVFDTSVAPLMSGSDALTNISHQYADAVKDLINN